MKDTWASGALELLNHADSHIELKTAFDKRIAFISIDNCVETAVRTFLALPPSKSGIKIPKKEIDDASNSFPKLVGLLFDSVPDRLAGLDNADIEHYHRIRNHLYHDGTGLSVDDRYLKAYRQIAVVLLDNLFGVRVETIISAEPSLERLILLWNEIESELKNRFKTAGIDYRETYKWELAEQANILDMQTVLKINELRMLRNKMVHSQPDELDQDRIGIGVKLGEDILIKLRG